MLFFFICSLVPLFLLLSAIFSATETALFSLTAVKVKIYQTHSDKKKQLVAKLLSRPQDLIVTIMMLNVFANVIIQNLISHIVGEEANWWIKVGLPLGLTLLFGEILPKSFAIQNNKMLAPILARLIVYPYRWSAPIRNKLIKIVEPVSSFMFFFLHKEKTITKEELHHILHTSATYGTLNHDEAKLIKGYIDLQHTQIKELIRPRSDILYYDQKDSLDKLKELFYHKECSRIPICNEGLENILGILTIKQFFTHQQHIQSPQDVVKFLTPPFFVPKTISAKGMLKQFQEKKEQIALVVDE